MNIDVPLAQLVGMLLASIRVVAWLIVAPPYNHRAIGNQVKVLLAVGIALTARPEVPEDLLAEGITEGGIILAALSEAFIGASLGFICLIVYYVIQAAGSIIDTLGGFMMAFTFDPLLNAGASTIGKLYHIAALTLLFATNGHLVVLSALIRTFDIVPLGQMIVPGRVMEGLAQGAGVFVMTALQIAGPLMAVLFLTDVGLGLLARIAPQLNILMLAFPLKIFVTLALLAASFSALPRILEGLTEFILELTAQVVR